MFVDTPIPGTSEVEAAKAASSYNYFSSYALDFRSGGDVPVTEGDNNVDGASVHDMFLDEDENLGYLEKVYLFARSKAVFHR